MQLSGAHRGKYSSRQFRAMGILVLALLASCLATPAAAAQTTARLLFISSYHPAFPTFFQQIEGLRESLASTDATLDIEFMDSKRFNTEEYRRLFQQNLSHKLARLPAYSVIIAGDDNALHFVLEHRSNLFPSIPIIFLGVNDKAFAMAATEKPDVCGIVESVSMEDTLRFIHRHRPAGTTAVIADATLSGTSDIKEFRAIRQGFPVMRFTEIDLSLLTFEELYQLLDILAPSRDAILLLAAYQDKTGRTLDFAESLARIRQHTDTPIFHLWEHGIGRGILGGKVVSHVEQGRLAGEMVRALIDGAPVSAFSIISGDAANLFIFDHRELARLKIAESSLPPGSRIINRPFSILTQYQREAMFILALFCLLVLALIYLVINVRRRIQAERALRDQKAVLEDEVRSRTRELQSLASHFSSVIESTTDAFFELDASFNLTRLNSKAEAILGVKQQEVLGRNLWNVFPDAKEFAFYSKYTKAMATQEVISFEEYYPPLEIWFEVHAYPTPASLSVYFQDITERKRAEHERQQLFELSMDLICVAGMDGKLRKINPAWTRTLGWSEKELTSAPWIDFVHPEDRQATLEAGAHLLEGQEVHQFSNRYRCRDGSYRWLSWNSVPLVGEGLIYAVVRDVTEQNMAQEALAASEDRFRLLVENAPVGMAITDSAFRVLFINRQFSKMTGYDLQDFSTVDEWHNLTMLDTESAREQAELVQKAIQRSHERNTVSPVLLQEMRCRDGSRKILQMQHVPVDERGVTLFIDITEQKRLERELLHLATTDTLTGLCNRRCFMDKLRDEWSRYQRYARPYTILMLDLDHFKRINDTFGHEAGDEVLRSFAAHAAEALRSMDVLGRLGGEEFAMLLPETDLASAEQMAERLRTHTEKLRIRHGAKILQVRVSIGAASASAREDRDPEAVLRRADQALYQAKQAGRNRVVSNSPG